MASGELVIHLKVDPSLKKTVDYWKKNLSQFTEQDNEEIIELIHSPNELLSQSTKIVRGKHIYTIYPSDKLKSLIYKTP